MRKPIEDSDLKIEQNSKIGEKAVNLAMDKAEKSLMKDACTLEYDDMVQKLSEYHIKWLIYTLWVLFISYYLF